MKAIYPIHMNPVVRKATDEELGDCDRIHIIEPIEVFLLVMRDTTERPKGVEAGGQIAPLRSEALPFALVVIKVFKHILKL